MSEPASVALRAIGSTSLPKATLSYRWVINDAQLFLDNFERFIGDTFTSPIFEGILPLKKTRVTQWQIKIKKYKNCSNEHYISIHLWSCEQAALVQPAPTAPQHKETSPVQQVSVTNMIFSVFNPNTNEVMHRSRSKKCSAPCVVGKQAEVSGCSNFIKQTNLATYLDGQALTLQVDATLLCFTDYSECVETCNDVLVPADSIREDLGSFCQGDLFADVTITCGGKEFRAHKVILASQSPVFKKMFEIDMKERRSGVIEVPDITPAVMSDLLAYLYIGTAPHVDTLARELLNVANKYELPRLLSICETTLVSKITANSVLEILILAELHETNILKKACLGFIKCNFAVICEQDSWKELKASATHHMLVFEVLEYCH